MRVLALGGGYVNSRVIGLRYECKYLSQWRSRVSVPKKDGAVKAWRLPTSESWAPGKAHHLCNSSCFIHSAVYPSTVACALQQSKLHSPDELIHLWKCTLPLVSRCWIWLMMEPWTSVFYSLSPPRLCPGVSAHKRNSCQPIPVLCSPVTCFISWDIQVLLLWFPRTLQHQLLTHTNTCAHILRVWSRSEDGSAQWCGSLD